MSFVNKWIVPYVGTTVVAAIVFVVLRKYGSKIPVIGSFFS